MPITLPAHAAGALPFVKLTPRWLHPNALVVGCCAPDLAYLFDASRNLSHSFRYGILCAVIIGVIFFVWLELLILPSVRHNAQTLLGVDIARMLERRWPRDRRTWVTVIAALALGALTHIAWDGFTHHGWWPAIAVYPARYEPRLTRIAWNLSTLIGTAVVCGFVLGRYPAREPMRVRRIAWVALFTTLAVGAVIFPIARQWLPPDPEVPHWPAQLMAMRGVFVAATLWCAVLRPTQVNAEVTRSKM